MTPLDWFLLIVAMTLSVLILIPDPQVGDDWEWCDGCHTFTKRGKFCECE